jgi:LysM repeat protein
LIRPSTIALLAGAFFLAGGAAFAEPADQKEAAAVDGDEAPDEDALAAKPKREWVSHKIVPGESFEDIGARYGVSKNEIIRWNKKTFSKKEWLYAGRTLKIYARTAPPPRERITYKVKFGDTWAKIATRYNVPVSDLQRWNKKVPKRFKAGTNLLVYTNPRMPPPGADGESAAPLPSISVRDGGRAVGKPHRGKLISGVRLPKSDLYTVRDPDKSFGTTHAVKTIHSAIAIFRRDTSFEGKIVIADLSKQGGGRMRPHKSHQAGRDADIRLPRKPGAAKDSGSKGIDWDMSWRLVKSFIDTGEVEYIFLDYSRQKLLLEAAKEAGVSSKQLKKYIQYPQGSKKNKGIVRHAKGHNVHIHVRVKCAPGNAQCLSA